MMSVGQMSKEFDMQPKSEIASDLKLVNCVLSRLPRRERKPWSKLVDVAEHIVGPTGARAFRQCAVSWHENSSFAFVRYEPVLPLCGAYRTQIKAGGCLRNSFGRRWVKMSSSIACSGTHSDG